MNIGSVKARLFKGAVAEGLRFAQQMITPRRPDDMRIRVLWDEITEIANKKHGTLKDNLIAIRDITCYVLDNDPPYTQMGTKLMRRIVARADIIMLSTGHEETVNRLIARKAELRASGAIPNKEKPYISQDAIP